MCFNLNMVFFNSNMLLFIIAFLLYESNGFYFDTKYSKILKGEHDSFGKSILLQSGNNDVEPLALVGVHRMNNGFYGNNTKGGLFRCLINEETCYELYIKPKTVFNMTTLGALGFTIDGGSKANDPFVVCDPKWGKLEVDFSYRVQGACFLGTVTSETFDVLHPFLKEKQQSNDKSYVYGVGQAGFSLNYKDKHNIFLGAPGLFNWNGDVVIMNGSTVTKRPDLVRNDNKIAKYMGYSITSAIFDKKFLYFVGAPRGNNLFGKVEVYNGKNIQTIQMDKSYYGSYFGASLLVANVTGHQKSLLVGAPTFGGTTFNEGRVVIFNYKKGKFEDAHIILDSHKCPSAKKYGSQFGAAMVNLGRHSLNNKYDSVAIASPYEDNGKGAIYIFLGGSEKLVCTQRITGQNFQPSLRYFGISFSNAVDIDNNNFNDVAVGSQGAVTVLKSKETIQINANLSTDITYLHSDIKYLNLTYCVDSKIDVDVNIEFNHLHVKNDTIHNFETCKYTEFNLKNISMDFIDSKEPFTVKMSYKQKEYCYNCPVVDPNDVKMVTLKIPTSQFTITTGFDNNRNVLILGEQKFIKFSTIITNNGNKSSDTHVTFTLPLDVSVSKCPDKCICQRKIYCNLTDILTHKQKRIEFDVDLDKLSTKTKSITIHGLVGNRNSTRAGEFRAKFKIKIKRDLTLTGTPDPADCVHDKKDVIKIKHGVKIRNEGPSLLENYTVFINIPNKLLDNKVQFTMVHTAAAEGLICEERDNMSEIPVSERIPLTKSRCIDLTCFTTYCKTFACKGDVLRKSKSVNVEMPFTLYLEKLIIHYQNRREPADIIVLATEVYIKNENEWSKTTIETKINTDVIIEENNNWIYYVSVIVALIILLIIILILYLCNFFKRKATHDNNNTEEAEEVIPLS